MQLDQGFRDRQAEAGAADPLGQAGVAAGEALEDVLQLVRRYSRSVVGHGDLHSSTPYPRRHFDRRTFGRVLMRIGKQIHQYLANPVGLDVDQGQLWLDLLRQRLVGALGLGAHRPHRVVDQRRDLGRPRRDRQAPGVAAGQVEQVVEQADQVAAVVEDDLDRLHLLGGERVALQHQQLGEALHRGERAAQLVRGGEDELVFEPVELVALARLQLELAGHLVEGGAEGGGLREPADLDPGAAVAAGEPPGRVDQLLERPSHRGDQAAEEEQGAGQAGDQAGGDEQRGVAGVGGDLVAELAARSAWAATVGSRGFAVGPARQPYPRRRSPPGRSGRSRPRSPGAAG